MQRLKSFVLETLQGHDSKIVGRLKSGGIWSLIGEAAVRLCTLLSSIFVARWLGIVEFGAFALIQSTLQMLAAFAMFGMGSTAARYIATLRSSDPKRVEPIISTTLGLSVLMGGAASLGLFILSGWVATHFFRAPTLAIPLRIVSPIAVIAATCGVLSGCVRGFEAFRRLARLNWCTGIVTFTCTILGVYFGGLMGAAIALLVSESVRGLLTLQLARSVTKENGFRLRLSPRIEEPDVLWKFSVPLVLGSALHAPIIWVCQSIITRQPDGLLEMGTYSAAQKLMTLVMIVPLAISGAFGPILANLVGSNREHEFQKTVRLLFLAQATLASLPAILVGICSPWAVSVFGSEYADATNVVVILMFLAPVFVLKHLYWQVFTAAGRAWDTLWLAVLWAGVAVLLTAVWQNQGAEGLAKAMLGSYGSTLVASLILVRITSTSTPLATNSTS